MDSKFQTEEEKIAEGKRLTKLPEIYAVLHPELYKNTREEEKAKLIQKFSKRQFSPADRIVPPICRTPLISFPDKRQEEKERLIKILSSCPAKFVNSADSPVTTKKLRRPKYISLSPCVPNEREAEKERLGKIFASSGIYYRKNLDQKNNSFSQRRHKENMVRSGEYSPLSSKERHPPLQTFNAQEDKPIYQPLDRKLTINNPSNFQPSEAKVERGVSTNDLYEIDENDGTSEYENSPRKRNSISTQTDPSDISNENREESLILVSSPQEKYNKHQIYHLSPREKLMSDLHGVSQCFPGISSKVSPREDTQDVKLRQAAYAKALQEQIEEKRRMEEQRRRKEKAEEELIQQKILLHQKRLEHELNEEQKKKEDWLAQRQSHEEVLRRKMLEMKYEAQELKKSERRKRRDSEMSEPVKESFYTKPPLSTLSEPCRQPKPKETERAVGGASESLLRLAPLLEADRQNVLSTYRTSPLAMPNTHHLTQKKGDMYGEQHKSLTKQRAENLLKAPLDYRITRPTSPPIPAVRTRGILHSNNSKLLDDKWQVPKEGRELHRTQAGSGRDNILTQLGAFRRQLHQEHVKLEARLQKQQSP